MTYRLSRIWLAWADVVSICAGVATAFTALLAPVTGAAGLALMLDANEAAAAGIAGDLLAGQPV